MHSFIYLVLTLPSGYLGVWSPCLFTCANVRCCTVSLDPYPNHPSVHAQYVLENKHLSSASPPSVGLGLGILKGSLSQKKANRSTSRAPRLFDAPPRGLITDEDVAGGAPPVETEVGMIVPIKWTTRTYGVICFCAAVRMVEQGTFDLLVTSFS